MPLARNKPYMYEDGVRVELYGSLMQAPEWNQQDLLQGEIAIGITYLEIGRPLDYGLRYLSSPRSDCPMGCVSTFAKLHGNSKGVPSSITLLLLLLPLLQATGCRSCCVRWQRCRAVLALVTSMSCARDKCQ